MKTVDAHRRHMREKLNLRSTSELIRYATRWISERGTAAGRSAAAADDTDAGDEARGT
jgi:hypothetical protein